MLVVREADMGRMSVQQRSRARDFDIQALLPKLVGDHTDRTSIKPTEPNDDITRVIRGHLVEIAIINQTSNHILHIICFGTGGGDDRV